VVEAACMAHARRKFWDVHEKTKSTLSRKALEKIAALYKIEDAIRGQPRSGGSPCGSNIRHH
jgi:transposase